MKQRSRDTQTRLPAENVGSNNIGFYRHRAMIAISLGYGQSDGDVSDSMAIQIRAERWQAVAWPSITGIAWDLNVPLSVVHP
jgi:hypothetical protein